MTAESMSELVSVHDAASLLGCSLRTLQRHRQEGRLEFIRRGREKFCQREQLELLARGDRTEVVAARLLAPECDAMLANEWFRHWAEYQTRRVRSSRVRVDCAPLLAEVEQRFGLVRMRDVTVGDLLGAFAVLGAPYCGQFLDLILLQQWPPEHPMLDARRQIACAVTGRWIGGRRDPAPWLCGPTTERTDHPSERSVHRRSAV